MKVLEIYNLGHTFPDGTIGLADASAEFTDGELAVIAGPNGSGKSVFARHIIGLLSPSSGSVKFPQVDKKNDYRIPAGLVFQDADSQIVGQTVYEDVAFGPENLGLNEHDVAARVRASLQCVGLNNYDQQKPHHLSGGEKRRLAIAGVLAMDPHILILDEPFSGLDYPGTKMVLETIVNLHRAGHTVIVITHDIQKILAHADRLIIMKDGTIVADDRPSLLIHRLEEFGLKGPGLLPGATPDEAVAHMTWLN